MSDIIIVNFEENKKLTDLNKQIQKAHAQAAKAMALPKKYLESKPESTARAIAKNKINLGEYNINGRGDL